MARPLRLEFPDALYHVTSRGNAKQDIFLDDDDRHLFLNVASGVIKRYAWVCHAYCLMGNHYHFLIETPNANLSIGMRQLNGVYTQRFNRRHARVGHVFQGRFKAILAERDRYLLELARYIVLNPLRAKMVSAVADYPWSSYQAMVGKVACPDWLYTDELLAQFDQNQAAAQRRYARFVAEGEAKPSPWPDLKAQSLLGSEAFVARLKPVLTAGAEMPEVPRTPQLMHRPSLEQFFHKQVFANKTLRDEAICRACLEFGYSMAAIASVAGVHYSTVSKVIKASAENG